MIGGLYSNCVCCGKHRYRLKEIVVPSGLGGVFCVEILSVEQSEGGQELEWVERAAWTCHGLMPLL